VAANDTLGPAMRNPDRRRPPPKAIRQTEDPSYWLWLGSRVWYGGSIYHKRHASWLGGARPRADASICPAEISREIADVWLKQGARNGWISDLRSGDFPTYIWYRTEDGKFFTAKITEKESGEYHGYPEWQDVFPDEFK